MKNDFAWPSEGTYDGIWDMDVQSGQAYFSPRYYMMMGYEPNEFPANYENWRLRVHPDDLERCRARGAACGRTTLAFRH